MGRISIEQDTCNTTYLAIAVFGTEGMTFNGHITE